MRKGLYGIVLKTLTGFIIQKKKKEWVVEKKNFYTVSHLPKKTNKNFRKMGLGRDKWMKQKNKHFNLTTNMNIIEGCWIRLMRWRETDSQTKRNDEQIDVDRSERDQPEKKRCWEEEKKIFLSGV